MRHPVTYRLSLGEPQRHRRSVMTPLRFLATLALVLVVLAGVLTAPASSDDAGKHRGWEPVPTTAADWSAVAAALGRQGALASNNTVYRVGFPRRDLTVTSYG